MRLPSYSVILIGLALVLLTALVYGQVLGFDFVHYDDTEYVTENPHVASGLTAANVRWSLLGMHAANWHPLTWISHMADMRLYGPRPRGHHLTNLIFHAINVVLLFAVLIALTGKKWPSAFVAALFAVHPLHVESVAWIAERKDVLSTFFWLLTMGAYGHYRHRPSLARYISVFLFLALGLLAKPMLVTLPCVLLLLDYWPLGRSPFRGARLTEKIPLFLLAAGSCIMTCVAQTRSGAVESLEGVTPLLRVENAIVSYVAYMGQMFWPVQLAVFYPHPGDSLPLWQVLAAGGLLAIICLLVVLARRRHPYLLVGWLWYLGTLVPVIGLVQVGEQARADRYTYVPLIGLFIMLAWGLPELVGASTRPIRRKICFASAVIAILFLAIGTYRQAGYWKNRRTLFEHALAITNNNAVAHSLLGMDAAEEGDADSAIAHYNESLRISPGQPKVHINLGNALLGRNQLDQAVDHYRQAADYSPNLAEAHGYLGVGLAQQGHLEQAVEELTRAIRLNPDSADLHNNLGVVRQKQGNLATALEEYTATVRLRPNFTRAHDNRAMILYLQGKYAEAWQAVQACQQYGGQPRLGLIEALTEKLPPPQP